MVGAATNGCLATVIFLTMANLQIAPLDSFQDQKKKKQALLKETVAQRANEQGVLLVRMDNIPAANGSALTERQRRWLDSAPYDSITQNPVLYKYAKDSCRLSKSMIEKEEARSTVKSLADSVIPSPPSGIGDKIIKRRRERHQQLVKDMEEELSMICLELESRVKQVSDEICSQLESNEKFIAELFNEVNPDEVLQKLTMVNLEQLWSKISSQSPIREELIQQLDTALQEVETDRAHLIEKVLCDYVDKFNLVSYILPEDVGRFIEAQGIFMNTTIISNRRNYIELCTHLRTMDCDWEKQHHKKWLSLVEEWKHLLYKNAFNSFTQFVEEDTKIIAVSEMSHLKEELTMDQKKLGFKRKELMDYILNLKPPKICPPLIYEWRENADKLYEDLDAIHSNFLLKTQQCLDTAHRAREDEMDRLRKHLTSSGAYDSYTAYEMMCADFLPLIDSSSKKMREDLQSLERGLDSVITIQKEQFSEVFQFVQEAALLWTNQQNAIEQMHKKYEEGLEKSRVQHDKSNQNLEANLDVVLDRLRQGHNEAVLKQYRNEALRMLETIKHSYSTFKDRVITEAKKLPSSLEPDLDFYDNVICRHLGVMRQTLSMSAKSRNSMGVSKTRTSLKKKSSKTAAPVPWNAPKIVINVRTSDSKKSEEDGGGGEETVTFFILNEGDEDKVERKTSSPKKRKKSESIFMTQDEDAESSHVTIATENIVLAGGALTQVIHGIRVNFLDHLEFWKRECIKIASQIVAEKEEATMTELDLRLHLHKPRPSRITEDIFNVRVAELSVHSERINRHAKGVVVSIEEHRNTTKDLAQKLNAESEKFMGSLSALKFTSVHNGRQLAKLKSEGDEIIAKHVTASEAIISEYKSDSDSQLQQLVGSTENYKSSLKLFQEGGNYCPEEIEDSNKKMDRIIGKVSSTKVAIAKEVVSLTKTHQQTTHDATSNFTRIYQIFLADIAFSETMSRGLVSVQISIKSEVAASNLKAKQIFADIEKVQKQISEAIEKKSLFGSFQSELTKLSSLMSKRAEYLYCCDSMFKPEDEKTLSPTLTPGKFSFEEEMADSHKSQNANPLSVFNVTKNIMDRPAVSPKRRQSTGLDNNERPKFDAKEMHPKTESKEIHFKMPTTTGGGSGQSAWTTIPSNSALSPATASGPRSRRHSLAAAVDRKDFTSNLGGCGGYKLSSFMPKIRSILKTKYNELFDDIDDYYSKRQMQVKDADGGPIYHLHSLKETPEGCLLAMEGKFSAYRTQAEEYRQDCIEEFQGQVKLLVPTLQEFIIMSSQEFCDKQKDSAKEAWLQDRSSLSEDLEKSCQDKKIHESSLQPALGRPDKEAELASLCSREEERHIKALKLITEHSQNMTERLKKAMFNILSELCKNTKISLHLVDGFISPSEITDVRPKVKTELEDLMRQQVVDLFPARRQSRASIGNISKPKKIKFKAITNRSMQWPNLSQNHRLAVLMPVKKARLNAMCDLLKERPISRKATLIHDEVIRTRDLCFEELTVVNADIMEDMKKLEEAEKEAEQKWILNWRTSVENVKDLYKL